MVAVKRPADHPGWKLRRAASGVTAPRSPSSPYPPAWPCTAHPSVIESYVEASTPRGKYDTNDAHDDLDAAAREARAAGERHFYGVHIIDAHWTIELRED
jgi:hypothetical protein